MIRRADDEGRLARWSRRKTEARETAASGGRKTGPQAGPKAGRGAAAPQEISSISTVPGAEGPAMPWAPPLADGAAPPPPAETAPEDIVTDADREKAAEMNLPDIESLGSGSDFTPFMREGVPAVLKRLALRKLWISNPAFAVLDGLNDYDENFRVTNVLIDAAETAYKAGKGYFTAEDEAEDENEAEENTENDEESPESADESADGADEKDSIGNGEDET